MQINVTVFRNPATEHAMETKSGLFVGLKVDELKEKEGVIMSTLIGRNASCFDKFDKDTFELQSYTMADFSSIAYIAVGYNQPVDKKQPTQKQRADEDHKLDMYTLNRLKYIYNDNFGVQFFNYFNNTNVSTRGKHLESLTLQVPTFAWHVSDIIAYYTSPVCFNLLNKKRELITDGRKNFQDDDFLYPLNNLFEATNTSTTKYQEPQIEAENLILVFQWCAIGFMFVFLLLGLIFVFSRTSSSDFPPENLQAGVKFTDIDLIRVLKQPIFISHFQSWCELAKSNDHINRDFEMLELVNDFAYSTSLAAYDMVVAGQNRYKDIDKGVLPYEHSRVVLPSHYLWHDLQVLPLLLSNNKTFELISRGLF